MAKEVTIYKGNIRKLYASDVVLQKDTVVPIMEEKIITDQALFTYRLHKFTNLDYGQVLPSEEEAMDYTTRVVEGGRAIIEYMLTDPNVTEEEKKAFFDGLKRTSGCIFVVPEEIKPSHNVTRKELKQLKKQRLQQKHF